MKLHYFEQESADSDDMQLGMAKQQGYVPSTCLLGGKLVMVEVFGGRDPCAGCNAPRDKCNGRPKSSNR
jgi:hypothetical protein